MSLLSTTFISSWVLVRELEDVRGNNSLSEKERRIAQVVLDAYRFPVEAMVLNVSTENEVVLNQVNANTLLDSDSTQSRFMSDPLNAAYIVFLKKGQLVNE